MGSARCLTHLLGVTREEGRTHRHRPCEPLSIVDCENPFVTRLLSDAFPSIFWKCKH